jgi:hypothetical protein
VPFRRNHRFFTDRIVFKIHESEHLISRVHSDCHGIAVLLLRHPIPTTLSRAVFPRVGHYLASSAFRDQYLTSETASAADKIVSVGDSFEVGILSWVLENLIPLRRAAEIDCLVATYEELLLEPEKMAGLLVDRLDLEDYDAVLGSMFRESTNIKMSSTTTLDILKDSDRIRRNKRLVTKWKDQVTDAQRGKCAEILTLFGIDAYEADRFLPSPGYCHFLEASAERTLMGDGA